MNSPAIEEDVRPLDSRFMMRVFYVFAALALASAGISAAGKWVGRSIAMAGHTEDQSAREIVIGNNVLVVPANAIRFQSARHGGVASRLDLYLRWPDMTGYTIEAQDDFNNAHGSKTILFLSFEEPAMSRDMSGRFDPIYSSLIVRPGATIDGGLKIYRFREGSGYLSEVVAVAERPDGDPFVARCLIGPAAEESLAPCERDVRLGKDLSLVYRFPRELLPGWRGLEAAVLKKSAEFLRTGD